MDPAYTDHEGPGAPDVPGGPRKKRARVARALDAKDLGENFRLVSSNMQGTMVGGVTVGAVVRACVCVRVCACVCVCPPLTQTTALAAPRPDPQGFVDGGRRGSSGVRGIPPPPGAPKKGKRE